jgi:hypothetical protein
LFSQLLNRGGALQVNGTWTYDAAAKQVRITLEQTQSTGLFRMPIEVRLTQAARTAHLIQLDQQRQTFSIPSETEPKAVELDPEAWVFGRLTFDKGK